MDSGEHDNKAISTIRSAASLQSEKNAGSSFCLLRVFLSVGTFVLHYFLITAKRPKEGKHLLLLLIDTQTQERHPAKPCLTLRGLK